MDERTSEAATALAALTICENLMAVLLDRNILAREDVEELLADAASVDAGDAEINVQAGEIIRDVMEGLTARHH